MPYNSYSVALRYSKSLIILIHGLFLVCPLQSVNSIRCMKFKKVIDQFLDIHKGVERLLVLLGQHYDKETCAKENDHYSKLIDRTFGNWKLKAHQNSQLYHDYIHNEKKGPFIDTDGAIVAGFDYDTTLKEMAEFKIQIDHEIA